MFAEVGAAAFAEHAHETARIPRIHRPEHQRAGEAEDRDARADADAQRRHRDQREGRRPRELPHAVARVPKHVLEQSSHHRDTGTA